jgi:hypothetical protein
MSAEGVWLIIINIFNAKNISNLSISDAGNSLNTSLFYHYLGLRPIVNSLFSDAPPDPTAPSVLYASSAPSAPAPFRHP